MNNPILSRSLLVIGFIVVVSSWFSIRPSSAHRYEAMLARHKADPESVTSQEWVMSKDDEGMTALALLIFGIPAFVVFTTCAVAISKVLRISRWTAIFVGAFWILFGGALHAMLWLE